MFHNCLAGAALDGRLKRVLLVRQQADQLAAAVQSSTWQAISAAWATLNAKVKVHSCGLVFIIAKSLKTRSQSADYPPC